MLDINELVNGFTGSEVVYRHPVSGFIYTEGVQYVANEYGCYWLLDAIYSHQLNKKVSEQPFQVWKLKRLQGFKFVLTCKDGNDNEVTQQTIPFSDFTGNLLTLWFVDGTLLLPSEY